MTKKKWSAKGMVRTLMDIWTATGDIPRAARLLDCVVEEERKAAYRAGLEAADAALAKRVWPPQHNSERITAWNEAISAGRKDIRARIGQGEGDG